MAVQSCSDLQPALQPTQQAQGRQKGPRSARVVINVLADWTAALMTPWCLLHHLCLPSTPCKGFVHLERGLRHTPPHPPCIAEGPAHLFMVPVTQNKGRW